MSLIRWAYEALCINEFSGLPLTPAGPDPRASSYSPTRPRGLKAQPGWCRELARLSRVLPGLRLRGAAPHLSLPAAAPVPGPADSAESQRVLQRLGFAQSSVRAALMAQLGIIAFNYAFTCAALMLQRPRSGEDPAHVAGRKFRLAPSDADIDAVEASVAELASAGNVTAVASEGKSATGVRGWLDAIITGCRWLLGIAPSQPGGDSPDRHCRTNPERCGLAEQKRVVRSPATPFPRGGSGKLS